MSSNFIYQIRKYSLDPLAARYKLLSERLAQFEAQTLQLQTGDTKNYIKVTNSINQYKEQGFASSKPKTTVFKIPFEPDLKTLTCWYRFDAWGKVVRDASFQGNSGTILGQTPTAAIGPDKGYGAAGTIAMNFDGTSQAIEIADHTNIQMLGTTTGFSVAALIYPTTFAATPTGAKRFIAEKIDGPNDMWALFIDTNGFIHSWIYRGGVSHSSVTTTTPLILNTWNWVVMTYNVSNGVHPTYVNALDMFANGKLIVDTPTDSTFPNVRTNMYVGSNAVNDGFFMGNMADFRYYREKVLTQAEVTNLNTNMITTSSIAFGAVATAGASLISA